MSKRGGEKEGVRRTKRRIESRDGGTGEEEEWRIWKNG